METTGDEDARGTAITSGWLGAIPYGERTIGGILERASRERPADVFFTFEGNAFTVSEVNEQVDVVAMRLREHDVRPGSRVAILMEASPEYLFIWFALAKLGAVEVPINTAYRGELLRYQLEQAKVELAITDPGTLLNAVASVRADVSTLTSVLGAPKALTENFAAQTQASVRTAGPSPEEIAAILYTSGTSGPSKGVLITQHHEVSNGHFFAHIVGLSANDVLLNYSPFFHIAGKFATLGCLLSGARMVLRSRLSVSRFWDEAREEGITAFIAIGGVCHMLYAREPQVEDASNPVRVAYAVPAPAEIYEQFQERFGLKIVEAYGSTETNLIVNSALTESIPGSCGRPNPIFNVSIVDDQDSDVPDGQPGEIVVSCTDPLLLSAGYDGMPEATAEAWRGGRFHTGDRAIRDHAGFIWFKDRIKDSIRRRGENISSYELERMLSSHPAVAESAATGAPSELGEDEVHATVVLAEGATATPEELYLHYSTTMPYHMIPRYIDIAEALPRTPTNKVEKYKLRTAGIGADTWDANAAGWRMTRDGLTRA